MKLGVFSDLHSNIYALEAMCRAASEVSQWICLGDFTGLFPPVNQTVQKIRDNRMVCVLGDHEKALLGARQIENSATARDVIRRQQEAVLPEHVAYIQALKDTANLKLDGVYIHAVHDMTPQDQGPSAKYRLDLAELDERFSDYDMVLFGHTHLPTICYGKNVVLVNPGAAGFPVDCARRPSFAVLDTATHEVQLKRFDFETDGLLRDIASSGYHQKFYDYVKNGFSWG